MKGVVIPKIGKSAFSSDPNDFIFHSNYNTFKIIKEGIKTATVPASQTNYEVTQVHGLDYIPLVSAYMQKDGSVQVCNANSGNVSLFGAKLGVVYDVQFVGVKADKTNITFIVTTDANEYTLHFKYYCLERIYEPVSS